MLAATARSEETAPHVRTLHRPSPARRGAGPEEVVAALRLACDGPHPIEERARHIEDGEVLAPIIDRTGQQFSGHHVELSVRGVRFLGEHRAQVRFAIILGGGGPGYPFEGELFRRDGTWVVTRDTITTMLRGAGVQLPPRAEPTDPG